MDISLGRTSSLIEALNSSYMGSPDQVISRTNPFANNILSHYRVCNDLRRQEDYAKRKAGLLEEQEEDPYLVTSITDLHFLPDSMKVPVLADSRIREFHVNNRISGWGITPDTVESAVGRFEIPEDEFDSEVSFNTSKVDDDEFDFLVHRAANFLYGTLVNNDDTFALDPSDPMGISHINDEIY